MLASIPDIPFVVRWEPYVHRGADNCGVYPHTYGFPGDSQGLHLTALAGEAPFTGLVTTLRQLVPAFTAHALSKALPSRGVGDRGEFLPAFRAHAADPQPHVRGRRPEAIEEPTARRTLGLDLPEDSRLRHLLSDAALGVGQRYALELRLRLRVCEHFLARLEVVPHRSEEPDDLPL